MQPERPVPILRTATFVALALWIALAPGITQLFGVYNPWIRTWRMYSGKGQDTCDVDFYDRTDGEDVLVDRLADDGGWWTLKPYQRRIVKANIGRTARSLCAQIGASDLRADAVCGTRSGWEVYMEREQNLCHRRRR